MTRATWPAALVLDGGAGRGALAACRQLGAAGWRVVVGSPARRPMLARSRFVTATCPVPWPTAGATAVAAAITRAVADHDVRVVLAGGDDWQSVLADVACALPTALAQPDRAAVETVIDKLWLARTAAAVGLSTPRTVVADPDALPAPTVWDDLGGEVIVKPRRHVLPDAAHPTIRLEALRTDRRDVARSRAEEIRDAGGEPLLQEVVEGTLEAVVGVRVEGRWLARGHQRTPGTWPWPAGSTSWSTTVPCDEDLADRIGALLDRAGWIGPVEAELLRPPGGEPQLIDLNGRIYGGMALAAAAGVPVADLAARLAVALREGTAVPDALPDARAGVTFCWLEGELRRAVLQADRPAALPAAVAGALHRSHTADVHPVGDGRDPLPAVAVLTDLAGRAIRRTAARDVR